MEEVGGRDGKSDFQPRSANGNGNDRKLEFFCSTDTPHVGVTTFLCPLVCASSCAVRRLLAACHLILSIHAAVYDNLGVSNRYLLDPSLKLQASSVRQGALPAAFN